MELWRKAATNPDGLKMDENAFNDMMTKILRPVPGESKPDGK
jgi:hypothetical protein